MSLTDTKLERSPLAIHPLLNQRYSPRAFADRPVLEADLELVLEAARWAPSSRNEQPWRFLVTHRDAEGHAELLAALNESNRRWAHHAPVLILCMVQRNFERLEVPNHHAWHDLGLAIAQLTLQASAQGMGLHQLGGFDPDIARERCGIPDTVDLVTIIALGYPGDASALPEDLRVRETNHSPRKPLEELVHMGRFRG